MIVVYDNAYLGNLIFIRTYIYFCFYKDADLFLILTYIIFFNFNFFFLVR